MRLESHRLIRAYKFGRVNAVVLERVLQTKTSFLRVACNSESLDERNQHAVELGVRLVQTHVHERVACFKEPSTRMLHDCRPLDQRGFHEFITQLYRRAAVRSHGNFVAEGAG